MPATAPSVLYKVPRFHTPYMCLATKGPALINVVRTGVFTQKCILEINIIDNLDRNPKYKHEFNFFIGSC